MSPLELGEVTVTRVIEIDRSSFTTLSMLPDSTPDAIARYGFAGEEGESWRHEKDACIADSVVPAVEAGQAALVDADYAVDDWLRPEPTPGHTPGHISVRLRTSAGEAVFSGDLMHRTV